MSSRVPAPPPETLAWLAAEVGAGARVLRCRRLVGGSASVVHAVRVEHRSGRREWIALKRYPSEWASAAGNDGGAKQIQLELERLEVVRRVPLPVPVVVGADVNGQETSGEPAIATTMLHGRVDFALADPDSWIRGAVATLASVHDLAVNAAVHRAWPDKSRLRVPEWTARPGLWEQALSLIDPQPPAAELTFTHGDYHTGNLLWRRGRVTGVLDWSASGRWYADADLAGARRHLALVFSVELGNRLVDAYRAETGRVPHPAFDVLACLTYQPWFANLLRWSTGGRGDVPDSGTMNDRVDQLVEAAVQRLR